MSVTRGKRLRCASMFDVYSGRRLDCGDASPLCAAASRRDGKRKRRRGAALRKRRCAVREGRLRIQVRNVDTGIGAPYDVDVMDRLTDIAWHRESGVTH